MKTVEIESKAGLPLVKKNVFKAVIEIDESKDFYNLISVRPAGYLEVISKKKTAQLIKEYGNKKPKADLPKDTAPSDKGNSKSKGKK